MSERVYVVCNPVAGRGRGRRVLDPLLAALRENGPVEYGLSNSAGDEARLARQAVDSGFRHVVAVGGDGTWNNVANALLATGQEDVVFGAVPGGTGSDLAKSLGIPGRDVQRAAQIIRTGRVKPIDVGVVDGRHFLNIAGFGFDVAVLEHSWGVPVLRGSLRYGYSAVTQLLSFRGMPVALGVDGAAAQKRDLLMLIIANARIFGGAFPIAPRAQLDDGQLDVVAFADMPALGRVGALVGLLRGTHESSRHVDSFRAARLRLSFPEPPTYELDGEWHRAAGCEVEVGLLPRRLRVFAGA